MQLTLFQPPRFEFNMLVIFSLKNVKQSHKPRVNIFICLLDHAYEVMLANIKMERQRWPEKLVLSWGRSECVAMVA